MLAAKHQRASARPFTTSKTDGRAVRPIVRLHASSTSSAAKVQPEWTGDNFLSKFVNFLINTPPLYSMMKLLAKQAMKNSAESRGISWEGHVQRMRQTAELEQLRKQLEDPSIQYPSYYLQPFHAYDDGNLNWLAAYEVEPATYAMAIRTFKKEPTLSPEQALIKLRTGISDRITEYYQQHSLAAPGSIVDMGCSTGISSRWFRRMYPEADIVGLDLSPYFLAVAQLEEQQLAAAGSQQKPIRYMHGIAERSPFPDAYLDMVSFQFVIHECPQQTIKDFITEAKRILKPGGVLTFVDNNPKSETIQNLPPALFTLMKSTEPWSDEYYSYDVEEAMREAGFEAVVTTEADHRHRAIFGIAN